MSYCPVCGEKGCPFIYAFVIEIIAIGFFAGLITGAAFSIADTQPTTSIESVDMVINYE